MLLTKIDLEQVSIASPCTANWEEMHGDDKMRFCDHCQKHVYNFASMTLEEGAALINAKEGLLCGRLSRRHDGTFIAKDCPVGLARKLERRVRFALLAAIVLLVAILWGKTKPTSTDNTIAYIDTWIDTQLTKYGLRAR